MPLSAAAGTAVAPGFTSSISPLELNSTMAHSYPITLDVRNRLIVIVGGGTVASRKVRGLLEAGAKNVRCVALNFDSKMPEGVERITEEFAPEYLDDASLVFAATDSFDVNSLVVRQARRRGILVCRVDMDEEDPGDFSVPAVWRDSGLIVAVSTGGSPAIAAKIRNSLSEKIERKYLMMVEVMQKLRPLIRQSLKSDPERRTKVLRDLAGLEAIDVLAQKGEVGLTQWLKDKYPDVLAEPNTKAKRHEGTK